MRDKALLWVGNDGYLRLAPPTGHTYREIREDIGASWDDDTEAWRFPALRTNVLQVIEALGRGEVDLSEQVLAIGDGHGFPLQEVDTPEEFYPFQREAVAYLVSNPHGSLLNVSPGLGKTAIAVVASQACSVSTGVLIVAPASLLATWWRQIEKWWQADEDEPGPEIEISHGNEPLFGAYYTITSYDTLAQHQDWFTGHAWDLVILDESVLIKTRDTQRYLGIKGGTKKVTRQKQEVVLRFPGLKKAGKFWLLSGNPTTRYADDLWTQLHLTYPKGLPSYWRFARRVCVFEDNIWAKTGESIVGTRESRDITWEYGDLMLTINQEDVLPDLPEYLYDPIEVDLTPKQLKHYQTMLRDFLIELDTGDEMAADNKLAQLVRLQQITSGLANIEGLGTDSAKADVLLELIEAQRWEFPMIVWSHWRGGARDLLGRLSAQRLNAEWVSGEDTPRVRDRKLEAYKAGDTDVLVLSLGVGKFGHTLTNTRTVVYLDKTWAADDYIQSLRRVRRIGLTWRPVLATLHVPRSVEELVEANLAGKMPSLAKVTNSQLKELLKGLGL